MLQLPPVKIDWEGRQHVLALPCPPIDLVLAASFQGSEGGDRKIQSLLCENPSLLIFASIKFGLARAEAASSLQQLSGWLISNLNQLHSDDGCHEKADIVDWDEIQKLACKYSQASKPEKKKKILVRFLAKACCIDRQFAKMILKTAFGPFLNTWFGLDRHDIEKSRIRTELINKKWGQLIEQPSINGSVHFSKSWDENRVDCGLSANGAVSTTVDSKNRLWNNSRLHLEHKQVSGAIKKRTRNPHRTGPVSDRNERKFQKRLLEEKLASLQQLAYGASHEINNPLANIATRAQSLLAGEKDPERLYKLGVIYEQSMRAHEMISDLMLFANPPAVKYASIHLRDFLRKLNQQVNGSLHQYATGVSAGVDQGAGAGRKIRFAIRIAPNVTTLEADATQLSVALLSLIRNSMEACRSGNEIIELRVSSSEEEYCFSVSDDGIGVAPEIQRHMFDPFYSGREAGRGLGFGLCKAWRIAQLHFGDLVFVEGHSPGARFELKIPIHKISNRD